MPRTYGQKQPKKRKIGAPDPLAATSSGVPLMVSDLPMTPVPPDAIPASGKGPTVGTKAPSSGVKASGAGGNRAPVEEKKKKEVKKQKIVYNPFTDDYKYENAIPNGVEMLCLRSDGRYHMCRILENKDADKTDDLPLSVREALAKGTALAQQQAASGLGKLISGKGKGKGKAGSKSGTVPPHPYIYYVHYLEYNRRMDEWVTRDRLVFQEEVASQIDVAEDEGDNEDSLTANVQGGGSGALRRLIAPMPSENALHEDHGEFDEESLKVHEEVTKVKNIEAIVIGKYEMETWYFSPFPQEYNKFKKLYFCEFCLMFYGHQIELDRHMRRCQLRHPPGNEFYRSDEQNIRISCYEVDGKKERIYCQNLCYIAKLFLDHKTLHFDTEPFLFYILTEVTDKGCHLVGYFSKEKWSEEGNNVACILTLPCHQRKGFGRFLISLSYELSKIEMKAGSPEKPLSDLGAVSYRSYWSSILLDLLRKRTEDISIVDISKITSMTLLDIQETLRHLGLMHYVNGEYVIRIPEKLMHEKEKKIDPASQFVGDCQGHKLHWNPYLISVKKARQAVGLT